MAFGPFLLLALMEGLVTAAALALAASGLSLVFGVMRVVNVAHGEFYMLGAVIAWFVTTLVPGPAWAAFLVALLVAPIAVAALAALADRLVLRRLNYDPEATIVATIGLLYMIQQAALTLYGPDARPVAAPFEWRLQLPWFGYSGYKLFVVAAAALVLLALWLFMTRSKVGLVMRATQVDREVAQAFGINVDLVYMAVFGIGAALAAVAAVLIVPIQQAHYLMGHDPLLLSFIVVIIGGLGSLRGTVVAALVIGLSDGVISMFFSPTLAKILATLLVALVLVFRPQGLFGGRER
ncbi:branched-chain amino acid ABC transporter permease [Neotabrizicola sp. sgz301269]|uniref:branched-chain amino acid ABC transporter permease n=1 Tax=Neotabrizicola sp. sgz301269 TaxID=3276282 RepID=UPI00377004A3